MKSDGDSVFLYLRQRQIEHRKNAQTIKSQSKHFFSMLQTLRICEKFCLCFFFFVIFLIFFVLTFKKGNYYNNISDLNFIYIEQRPNKYKFNKTFI